MIIEAVVLAARLLTGGVVNPAETGLPSSSYMALGSPVAAPVGYVRFCQRRPERCDGASAARVTQASFVEGETVSAGDAEPDRVYVTRQSWAAMNAVNRQINEALRPMTDEQAFGLSNYWTLPIEDEHRAVGNCKHYALEKRAALIAAGLSPSALSLAVARTGWGEIHAVLIVTTNKGEFVLDNLEPGIRPWRDARYRWLARQAPGHPMEWVSLEAAS